MKGFVACCLASVPMLLEADLKKPVYFAFSFDEEIGCMAGDLLAGAIRDFYDERPAGAIIGEPSMLQPMVGQKGIMVYTTVVEGSQGHSSRIKEEVDAIHEAARLVVWLEDKMDGLIAAGRTDDRLALPSTSSLTNAASTGTSVTFPWMTRRRYSPNSKRTAVSAWKSGERSTPTLLFPTSLCTLRSRPWTHRKTRPSLIS